MKYGTHNSLTYAKLVWWQRPFAWLINPFCRCQDKDITAQVKSDVVAFDIQIALYKDTWKASHGIAWYDVDVIPMLEYLDRLAYSLNTRFAIRIGLDRHFFRTKKKRNKEREEFEKFIDFLHTLRHLFFVEVYVEYPEYKVLEEFSQTDMEQRYWSLSFAREKAQIFPAHVLTVEIINRGFHNPYKTLNELYYEGKIEWHRTINDIAFTVKK